MMTSNLTVDVTASKQPLILAPDVEERRRNVEFGRNTTKG